jgi:hypothetical protein
MFKFKRHDNNGLVKWFVLTRTTAIRTMATRTKRWFYYFTSSNFSTTLVLLAVKTGLNPIFIKKSPV